MEGKKDASSVNTHAERKRSLGTTINAIMDAARVSLSLSLRSARLDEEVCM